jgi:hypothetical protein
MSLLTNLIAAWSFDTNFTSSGGVGYDLSGSGISDISPGGKIGSKAVFSSDGWYLSLGSPAGLDPDGDVGFTIAGWVQYGAFAVVNHYIASCIDGGTGTGGWYLKYFNGNGGELHAAVRVSGTTDDATVASVSLQANTWYHLALVHDPDTDLIYLYKDGSLVAQQSHSTGMDGEGVPFYFNNQQLSGSPATDNDNPSAEIDEWAAWSRALSAAEILQLYNGGSGLAYPFTVASGYKNMFFFGVG